MQNDPSRGIFPQIGRQIRGWLRTIHRDVGYLAIGLTVVYALSGIAVNHLGSWDPNFKEVTESVRLEETYIKDEEDLTAKIISELGLNPDDVSASFFDSETVFEIILFDGSVRFDTVTGTISITQKEPRFFLRIANWLHYNRGKKIWTYIADAYAVLLLYLAISGAFMLKGRKGLIGRGAILILLGAAVPFIYVQLISGP